MKRLFFLALILMVFIVFPQRQACSQDIAVLDSGHALHASFLEFAYSRIQVINRSFMHTPDKMQVENTEALYTARYQKIDPSTVVIEVKKVNSVHSPFIGVLQYVESIYEGNGQCSLSVVQGPFTAVHHRKVTEIFRFFHNRWQ